MRNLPAIFTIIITSISQSLGMELILKMAREFIPGYDINSRLGFPPSIPVPLRDATRRIVHDINETGLFLELVEWLIKVDSKGYMGKLYKVSAMSEILDAMKNAGFILDQESGLFYEDPRFQKTPNWGRLIEGREYPFTLLKLDIVKNSQLVRNNSKKEINSAYETIRIFVRRIIEKRRGRIWLWEGDGGIIAFHYGHPIMSAVLSGMEILNELMVFNLTANPLNRDVMMRIAAHAGFIHYSTDTSSLLREETVKEIHDIESRWTPDGMMTISASIAPHIDGIIKERIYTLEKESNRELFAYSINYASEKQNGSRKKEK